MEFHEDGVMESGVSGLYGRIYSWDVLRVWMVKLRLNFERVRTKIEVICKL